MAYDSWVINQFKIENTPRTRTYTNTGSNTYVFTGPNICTEQCRSRRRVQIFMLYSPYSHTPTIGICEQVRVRAFQICNLNLDNTILIHETFTSGPAFAIVVRLLSILCTSTIPRYRQVNVLFLPILLYNEYINILFTCTMYLYPVYAHYEYITFE